MPVNPMNRREFVQKSAVTGAAVAVAGAVGSGTAEAATGHAGHAPEKAPRTWSFSILGTTDLHSHVFDWDYYTDAAYTDGKGNSVGVARIATLVEQQRAAKGEDVSSSSTRATSSRAPRSPTTSRASTRSPGPTAGRGRSTPWPSP